MKSEVIHTKLPSKKARITQIQDAMFGSPESAIAGRKADIADDDELNECIEQ